MSSEERNPLLAQSEIPPATWYDYYELARLHKFPLGNILVFWPCAWGLLMAAYRTHTPLNDILVETLLFAVGSTLLHSAACVLNDICDVDLDRQVERTRNRPLARGSISILAASVWLIFLTSGSVGLLFLTNKIAFRYGLIGLFPLHALYPLMKRWTYWPQAWLGLAMNWGYPTAWLAITSTMDWPVVGTFFAGTVCWTIVYDTIYGCQDIQDDLKAGIKSTSILFGSMVRPILAGFATLFLAAMAYSGFLNDQGVYFFSISIGGTALFFIWVFTTWDVKNVADCGAKFEANGNMGVIIWLGLFLDYYYKGA
ncbi:unnamed protein product [Mycena citricolor]|uniref:4-hydroxybenzoate polyprenyltransferase, mitochondrial n=1 Tax=Mycena citricolor TaxID=2018698 RepID=A0AAD2Q3X5_9AGAR|nr:unnamed protein product [Mycena citricolor]